MEALIALLIERSIELAGHLGDGLAEDPQGGGHLGLADGQGGRHPDARPAALEDEQAPPEGRLLDRFGLLGRVELDAQHQALAAHVADQPGLRVGEPAQPGQGLLAPRGGVGDQAAFEQVEGGQGRRAGDRVAPEGRAVGARAPGLQDAKPGRSAPPSGIPLAMPLAESRMSGWTAPVLDRPHPAGPAGARLDLVGDEQDPVAIADRAQARQEAVLGHDVAALALDRLDDDRGDLVGRGELVEQDLVEPAQVVDLAEGRVEDPRQERPEAGVVLRLRGGQADRAVGPAVERAEEGDDVRADGWRGGRA